MTTSNMTHKKHKLIVATRNLGKLAELTALLKDLPLEVFSLIDLCQSDTEETGKTFRENAELKTRACWQPGVYTLADDSGLCVHALHGAPGVNSARFAGEPKNDEANIQLLLKRMQSFSGKQRAAQFICALVLKGPSGKEYAFEGKLDGMILREKKGHRGFGYDPVFYLPKLGKTMAELAESEKNRISHRAQAFRQLHKVLVAVLGENA